MTPARPDHRSPLFGSPGRESVELTLRETWPDEGVEDDHLAIDAGTPVGRVHRSPGARGSDPWVWSTTFIPTRSGRTSSRREAMVALEDAYNAWRAVREILPLDHPSIRGSQADQAILRAREAAKPQPPESDA